jgi:uncharacterized membrane protein
MSLPQIAALSGIEIVGDTFAKFFANSGGIVNLSVAILGYVLVAIQN